ncbi:hypothetical protein L1987_71438 [Smallanthus sonchifolius]|uniref:Uncharacterized protein n=1 Tax=Smallanthus sonchifolius TaxID=185202 RepID=A0ACB9AWR3_9ASTR|nr:hypothetical protein L1987_71438 [Smallanthus sonchifolius]
MTTRTFPEMPSPSSLLTPASRRQRHPLLLETQIFQTHSGLRRERWHDIKPHVRRRRSLPLYPNQPRFLTPQDNKIRKRKPHQCQICGLRTDQRFV